MVKPAPNMYGPVTPVFLWKNWNLEIELSTYRFERMKSRVRTHHSSGMKPIRTLPGSRGRTGRGQASPEAGVAAEDAAERARAAMKGFWTAERSVYGYPETYVIQGSMYI